MRHNKTNIHTGGIQTMGRYRETGQVYRMVSGHPSNQGRPALCTQSDGWGGDTLHSAQSFRGSFAYVHVFCLPVPFTRHSRSSPDPTRTSVSPNNMPESQVLKPRSFHEYLNELTDLSIHKGENNRIVFS